MLMARDAVIRGDTMECVHHELTGMVDLWAESRWLECLNIKCDLDISIYGCKKVKLIRSREFKLAEFLVDRHFKIGQHEAVALTGCTRYLAAATYSNTD